MIKKNEYINLCFIIGIIIIILTCFCSCKLKDDDMGITYTSLCEKINIKIPEKAKVENIHNSQGGFHGDGQILYKVTLDKKESQKIEKQIEKVWNKGKLSDEVDEVLYGNVDNAKYIDLYGEKVMLPKIENGYWKLVSEYDESLLKNHRDFYFAVYDKENLILYLYENHA